MVSVDMPTSWENKRFVVFVTETIILTRKRYFKTRIDFALALQVSQGLRWLAVNYLNRFYYNTSLQ